MTNDIKIIERKNSIESILNNSSIELKRKGCLQNHLTKPYEQYKVLVVNSCKKIPVIKGMKEIREHYNNTLEYLTQDFSKEIVNKLINHIFLPLRRKNFSKCLKVSESVYFVFYYIVYESDITNVDNTSYIFYWEVLEIE
jgi:hypothetical protein